MQLVCPHCRAAFVAAERRPSFCAYCGKPLPADETPSATDLHLAATDPPEAVGVGADDAPQQVGGYRLVRPLGRGGMGAVYEAEDVSTGRRVALKLLAPEFASSPSAVERFRREGRLASRIIHPRCVFVLAADEDAGRPYIVMELMPGETLKDLVEREGPLPPARAVELLLDVVEGLRETHRLGLIHRDVKPSNCFLEADGRVKVGDFGLAKSLVEASDLTRPGTFVGTALFASPEQVKKEGLDARTDVYSAAATLYFLLTGRAPFASGDALATMARIVSDDPPSLRQARPDVSDELDRVVLRGLARDPARRWPSAEDFEAGLLPFLPGYQSGGDLGARFGAFLLDYLFLNIGLSPFVVASMIQFGSREDAASEKGSGEPLGVILAVFVIYGGAFLYFVLTEWLGGCSPGKRLLGLRVRRVGGLEQPGFGRIIGRTCAWVALILLATGCSGLGILLMAAPMRKRNGYRGLHDWLTGTCVVRISTQQRGRAPRQSSIRSWSRSTVPGDLPTSIGPFHVTGTWPGTDDERILLAEDPKLRRMVCVWLRESGEPASPTRRELTRPARLRWLAGGETGGRQWDAFVAPAGQALPLAVQDEGPLAWKEMRPLLEQLAEELDAAGSDGTLPASLTVEQIAVRPEGVELLDFRPCPLANTGPPPFESSTTVALLHEVAALGLGVSETPQGPTHPPLPGYVSRFLLKLRSGTQTGLTLRAILADLAAFRDRPTEVTRGWRAGQLAMDALINFLVMSILMMNLSDPAVERWAAAHPWMPYTAFPGVWVIWAYLWRGAPGLHMFGLCLAVPNGRLASRLRCAWRAFLVLTPFLIGFIVPVLLISFVRQWPRGEAREHVSKWLEILVTLTTITFPCVCLTLILWRPQRSLFDRLAGTYVVPK